MSSSYVVFANLREVCCSNTAEVRLLRFSEIQERWRAYECWHDSSRWTGNFDNFLFLISVNYVFHKLWCLNVWFVLDALQSRLFHGTINLIQSGRWSFLISGGWRNGCYAMPLMMKISLIFQRFAFVLLYIFSVVLLALLILYVRSMLCYQFIFLLKQD